MPYLGAMDWASMRPRFMNRGSADGETRTRIGRLASMRPRFMNRGSLARRRAPDPRTTGFNEAPIHESGKSCLAVWTVGRIVRLQ